MRKSIFLYLLLSILTLSSFADSLNNSLDSIKPNSLLNKPAKVYVFDVKEEIVVEELPF